jgi:hypothetical protein
MNVSKIAKEILAAQVEIGPGVTLQLIPTNDKMGFEINLEGSFMHGGLTKEEITKKIKDFWETIDGSF